MFNYTDHLGNIRLSWAWDDVNDGIKIIEENHYYPFGLKHRAYNTDQYSFVPPVNGVPGYAVPTLEQTGSRIPQNPFKYKYQGQERQEEIGLNWDSFKWRNYDYAIGRFMSIDPLTEEYNTWSPYAFSGNRVIDSKELEGLEPVPVQNSVSKFGNWLSNKFNTTVANTNKKAEEFGKMISNSLSKTDIMINGKPERTNENIAVSLRSKNGGGENPTTTGSADDHWNVDGFFSAAAASGSPITGNNLKTMKDILNGIKDAKSGFDLGNGIVEEATSKGTLPAEKPRNTITVIQFEKTKDGGLNRTEYNTTSKPVTDSQAKKDSANLKNDSNYIIINRPDDTKNKK